MYKVRYEVEVITPLFMSGADTKDSELREQSIKGLLRFWWRMANPKNSIDELKKKEFEIFGSADKNYGKSKIIIQIENKKIRWGEKGDVLPSHTVPYRARGRNIRVNILDYLAYGVVEYQRGRGNLINKEYIKETSKFDVILKSHEKEILDEVQKAFNALVCFGGLGSKSHNGFGNLHCDNINCNDSILREYTNMAVSYPAFNNGTRLFQTGSTYRTWDEALFEIGKIYREIRLSLDNRHYYDKRRYIASPINQDRQAFLSRHAKSLFLKVRKENNGFRGYILFVPYMFLRDSQEFRNERLQRYNDVYAEFIEKLDGKRELTSII